MSIKFGAVIIGAASLFFACEAKADTLEFKLDNAFNGTSPSSTAPWLTATFSPGLVNGTVELDLRSSLNVSSEFFGSLGFNFNPSKSLTGVSQTSGLPVDGINWGVNTEDLQGGGNDGKGFDVMIRFVDANNQRFQGTDLLTFVFSGSSALAASDFNFFNASGLPIGAHVQGLGNGVSGAVTGAGTGNANVPDGGSTLILLGIGTTLFAFVRRAFIS